MRGGRADEGGMINFPDTPTLAQIFTTAGSSWQWDGNKWEGATVASGGPYLLLTGGTLTGQLTVNPNIVIGNAVTSPPATSLIVNTAASTPQVFGGPAPVTWGAAEVSVSALIDSYGAGGAFYIGRKSRGTAAAPSAVQLGDNLVTLGGYGRAATLYSGIAARMDVVATENWSDAATGTQFAFTTTTPGTPTPVSRVRISQGVVVGNPAPDPGQGGLVLNANAAAPQPTTFTPQIWLAGLDAAQPAALLDGYGGPPPVMVLRRSLGTAAAPTAVSSGANLAIVAVQGRGATSYFTGAQIVTASLEAWTDTAQGSRLVFQTAPLGGTGAQTRGWFAQGAVVADGTGNPPTGGTGGDMGPGTINVASGYYVNGGGAAGVALVASGNSYINGGNVGIGTTGPGAKLHVAGPDSSNLLYVSGGSKAIRIGASSTTASIDCVDMPVTSLQPLSVGGSIVLLTTNGSERMRLDTTGNVGIGTTAPTEKLSVYGQAAAGASVTAVRSGPNGADATTSLIGFQSFDKAVTIGGIVRSATNQVTYVTTSDERLKDGIKASERGLDALMAIKVSDYRMGETSQQGLLAQEVAQVYPEAVHQGGKDPNLEPWMLDYGRLTPLLIKGMQQQQEMIAALQAKVVALEGGAR
jgi:hypothetical protein